MESLWRETVYENITEMFTLNFFHTGFSPTNNFHIVQYSNSNHRPFDYALEVKSFKSIRIKFRRLNVVKTKTLKKVEEMSLLWVEIRKMFGLEKQRINNFQLTANCGTAAL